jgi:glucokinase
MPFLFEEMNSCYVDSSGSLKQRLLANIYNLDDEEELLEFTKNESKEITIHGSTKKISYDPTKRIGIGFSRIGTTKAISIGAYTFALKELDKK